MESLACLLWSMMIMYWSCILGTMVLDYMNIMCHVTLEVHMMNIIDFKITSEKR